MLANLLSHFVIKGQKSATFGLLRHRGRPKYVKGSEPKAHPTDWASRRAFSVAKFMGTSIDLEKLTLRPVEREKYLGELPAD